MNKQVKFLAFVLCLTVTASFTTVPSLAKSNAQGSALQRKTESAARSGASSKVKKDPHSILITYKKGIISAEAENQTEKSGMDAEDSAKTAGRTVVKARLDSGTKVSEAVSEMNEKKDVAYAQPNYIYKIAGAKSKSASNKTAAAKNASASSTDKSTSDPYIANGQAYQLKTTNAEQAWTFLENRKHATTTVAVIDTGVDTEHEDLQKNLITKNGCYTRIANGTDSQTKDDSGEHGTHVSGIIGMTYGNGKGAAGIAAGHHNDLVRVLMIGASSDGETLSTFDVANALNLAQKAGAKVVNMSFGFGVKDRILEQSLRNADEHGMTLVAASGNDSNNYNDTPEEENEVISVNAANEKKKPASFSDFGTTTDVSAPGFHVLSTLPGDSYAQMDGTSMASPCVAAEAALVLDANPDLTPQQVRNIICGTTDSDHFSQYSAYGNIDCLKAVQSAASAGNSSVSSLEVKPSELDLTEGDDCGIDSLVRPASCTDSISWSSADPSIAAVSSSGIVSAKKAGKTTITAACGGKTASVSVTVKPETKASSITIAGIPSGHEILLGDSRSLTAVIAPLDASNMERYWSSDNPDVLYCDGNTDPVLTARHVGKASITVRNYDGSVSDQVTLSVKKAPDKIKITRGAKSLKAGSSSQFKALASENGHSKDVSQQIQWSISGSAAHITADGLLTARKAGTVYVTASVTTLGNSGSHVKLHAVKKVKITKSTFSAKTKRHAASGNSARTSQKSSQTGTASPGSSAFVSNESAGRSNAVSDFGKSAYTGSTAAARSHGKTENTNIDSGSSGSRYTVYSNIRAAAHTKSTGNSVEDLRQKYILALGELDNQYSQNRDMYNPEVKKEIEQARSAVQLRLEMLQTPYQAADASNYYTNDLAVYQQLLNFNKSIAPESGSLKDLKSTAVRKFQALMPKNKKKYSAYYWGIIQNIRSAETKKLKQASTYSDLIQTCNEISNKYDIVISLTGDDDDDISISDLISQLISGLGSSDASAASTKPWYSLKAAGQKRASVLKSLKKNNEKLQKSPVVSASDKASMAKLYKQDVSEVKTTVDVEEIRSLNSIFTARTKALLTVTDPASKYYISTNEKSRLCRNINSLYLSLPLKKLSQSARKSLWGRCQTAQTNISAAPNRPEAVSLYSKITKTLKKYK
ncbi:MAG: S8 family serine peptidase [Eubacterium sp.]